MRDQELILRFFALYFNSGEYHKPMKKFLNLYMARNRNLQRQDQALLTRTFGDTVKTISQRLGDQAFKPLAALNAAMFDALMVGISRRLEKGPVVEGKQLNEALAELYDKPEFTMAIERATSDEESVARRINLATVAFAEVQ
jgi:hypothetical protein